MTMSLEKAREKGIITDKIIEDNIRLALKMKTKKI